MVSESLSRLGFVAGVTGVTLGLALDACASSSSPRARRRGVHDGRAFTSAGLIETLRRWAKGSNTSSAVAWLNVAAANASDCRTGTFVLMLAVPLEDLVGRADPRGLADARTVQTR
jgi:hypothetical protein